MAGLWLSHHIGNFITPTDFHIFQRGWVNHQPDYSDLTVAEAWNHGEDSGNRPKKSVLQVSESFSAISQTSFFVTLVPIFFNGDIILSFSLLKWLNTWILRYFFHFPSENDSTMVYRTWNPMVKISAMGYHGYFILVGGFKHFLFSISYMGCHPEPIDELIFFKMAIAPPTRSPLYRWFVSGYEAYIYIISWIIMEENPNTWPFKKDNDLVGGLEHGFYVSIQLGIIITPTDYIIFFRGVGTPPTSIWWLIFLWDLLSNKTIYQSVPRPEEGEPPENPATVFQAATVFRDICRLANEKMTCKYMYIYINLVGGLEHFLFFHILGIIIPTDSYFSEGLKPPTIYIYTHDII